MNAHERTIFPVEVKANRLYGDLAFLYPFITPPGDYAEEARHWRDTLRSKLGLGRHKILELGVGGGHNLSHLTEEYEAEAADISEDMLEYCSKVNPGVKLYLGDMRTLRLEKKYRAILIHDAISYICKIGDLGEVFKTAAYHLEKDGVIIISPDHFRDDFSTPLIESFSRADENLRVTYFQYTYDPDPADDTIETIMTIFIEDKNGLRIEFDKHITGLFYKSAWFEKLSEAGFEVEEREFPLSSLDRPYSLIVGVFKG